MNRGWKPLFLAVVLFWMSGLSGCANEVWEVEPYLVPCTGVGPQLCMSYKVDGKERLTYQSIEGFTFKWGVRQSISVSRSEDSDAAVDDSTVTWSLNEVLSSENVAPDSSFTIPIAKFWLKQDKDSQFLLVTLKIDCETHGTCDALQEIMDEEDNGGDSPTYLATFDYPDSSGASLTLRSLKKK